MACRLKLLLISFFCFLTIQAYCQDHENKFRVFNEYSIDINYTMPYYKLNSDFSSFVGLGIGAHHVFRENKRLEPVFGFKFQLIRSKFDSYEASKYDNLENVAINLGSLNLPFFLRMNFGNKIKTFIKTGLSVHIPIASHIKGNRNSYNPITNSTAKESLNELFYGGGNCSVNIGLGFSVPYKKGLFLFDFNFNQPLFPMIENQSGNYTPYLSSGVRFRII